MIVLGIETSCDETALALYDTNKGLLGHLLHSQIEQLNQYGGVIPEIAARYHIQYLIPLLKKLLNNTNITLQQINLISYTKGPGLVGSLLTGISFAKTLALALNIPSLGINHLEGHLLACFIEEASASKPTEQPSFPFLTLLASGGHTMLIQANNFGDYKILGDTLDDAAGEALDKTAKLLGIQPPNGKALSMLAAQADDHNMFYFSRPFINKNSLNFSFSGIKTAAMLKIKELSAAGKDNYTANLAYAFLEAVIDTLIIKSLSALKTTNLDQLVIAGGVSANQSLRNKLSNLAQQEGIKVFLPKLEFCTDNAAMIALAGAIRASKGIIDLNLDLEALPRWNLERL